VRAAFPDWSGNVVARQVAEQKLAGVSQEEIEDDRSEAGDHADRDAQQQPLLQVARLPDRRAESSAGSANRGDVGLGVILRRFRHAADLTNDVRTPPIAPSFQA
jgi:hypothetical protein